VGRKPYGSGPDPKPYSPRGEKPAYRNRPGEGTPERGEREPRREGPRRDDDRRPTGTRPPRREDGREVPRRPPTRREPGFSDNRFPPQRDPRKPYERKPRPGADQPEDRRPGGDRRDDRRSGESRPARPGAPRSGGPRPSGPRPGGPRPFGKGRPGVEERKPGFNRRDERGPRGREERNSDEPKPKRTPNYRGIDRFKETAPPKVQKKIAARESKSDEVRLNRYIANAGICSRRDADKLIEAGEIKVNGKVVTEMGYQVQPGDTVKYGNRILNREKQVYVLLNKPKDFITTTDDPNDRKTVLDLVKEACDERIYPVGRLDRTTTGLLLLTNDGELADKLTHPSNEIEKIYQVEIDKPLSEEHFQMLQDGFELEDGFIKADEVGLVTPDAQVVGIKIHSGRNRIVRRMFEHLGYEVTKLDRTVFAGLNKKDLPRGEWRFLTEREVIRLKYLI
jgi:23S rRNA pseudouridine2605 synthase